MQKYWFKSKSFGWGWTPCSREGWIVTIGFIVALIALSYFMRGELESGKATNFLIYEFGLIALLILIAYKTGEKPTWNWGKKKEKPIINKEKEE